MRSTSSNAPQSGLTVVELLITIAIIGILIAIAYPIIVMSGLHSTETVLRSDVSTAARMSTVAIQREPLAVDSMDVTAFVTPIGRFESASDVRITTFGNPATSFCIHGTTGNHSMYYLSTTGLYTVDSPDPAHCPA